MNKSSLMILSLIIVLAFAVPVLACGDGNPCGTSEANGWTFNETHLGQGWDFSGGCDGCDNMSLSMGSSATQLGKAGLEIKGKGGADFGYETGYYQEQNAPGAIQQSWGKQYGEVWSSSH